MAIDPLANRGTAVLRDAVWETSQHARVRGCCRRCRARLGQLAAYHAVLGLPFNLQSVHGASELDDLRLAALLLLRAGHHLLVQLLHLKHSQRPCMSCRRTSRGLKGPWKCEADSLVLSFLPPYLRAEPSFHISAVCLHDRLVLTSCFL